ncbi:MAG TPA: rhodanese-like domain-containing protein, partial [Candidatus Krumholzibacteria bacterium]|nr:rhodanese-like domain-containing protein [Candidatus Krumholzibacteria bacterium]
MQKRWTWMLMILVALAACWGCSSSDDDNPGTPAATSFEVMAEAGAAYLNDSAACPGIIAANTLHDNLDSYTVIDIRSASAYIAGHIPGAYNSSLATLMADLDSGAIP